MRGYVFMLESVFAGLILVGFMLYLGHAYTVSGQAQDKGFSNVLPELEQAGLLRGHAYSGDIPGIESEIYIPGHSHSVQLCDISGSCTGERPSAGNVWVSGYFLSGDGSFEPMEVRLHVW